MKQSKELTKRLEIIEDVSNLINHARNAVYLNKRFFKRLTAREQLLLETLEKAMDMSHDIWRELEMDGE